MTMEDPILITGCARSGTSMTAGIIHAAGAFGGTMSGPTQFNARGMFENAFIRNEIIKPYLRRMGVDPLAQCPLPNVQALLPFPCLRDEIRSVMMSQGYTGGPWFYKCAKACLIWPEVHKAFPKAKWVIVRRADKEIVASCLRTAFMRAYKTPAGWQSWVDVHKKRFREMHDAGLNVVSIWPSQFIAGDFEPLRSTLAWLGLPFNEAQVVEFVSPSLWNKGGDNGGASNQ